MQKIIVLINFLLLISLCACTPINSVLYLRGDFKININNYYSSCETNHSFNFQVQMKFKLVSIFLIIITAPVDNQNNGGINFSFGPNTQLNGGTINNNLGVGPHQPSNNAQTKTQQQANPTETKAQSGGIIFHNTISDSRVTFIAGISFLF